MFFFSLCILPPFSLPFDEFICLTYAIIQFQSVITPFAVDVNWIPALLPSSWLQTRGYQTLVGGNVKLSWHLITAQSTKHPEILTIVSGVVKQNCYFTLFHQSRSSDIMRFESTQFKAFVSSNKTAFSLSIRRVSTTGTKYSSHRWRMHMKAKGTIINNENTCSCKAVVSGEENGWLFYFAILLSYYNWEKEVENC